MRYSTAFLEKLYEHKVRTVTTRITLLDWQEKPLGRIDGVITDGSYNADGNSAVRRNISLSLSIVDRNNVKVFEYIDISKKVQVEIGLENTTDEHRDEDFIWFNMGTYILLDPSLSHDADSMSMTLQAQDKMALMNGTIGGDFSVPTTFVQRDSVTGDKSSLSWREIFYSAAVLFGEEDPGKVVINEVPDFIYDYVQVKTISGMKEDFIHVNAPVERKGERIIVEAWSPTTPETDMKFRQSERLYKLAKFGPPDPVETDASSNEIYMKNPGEAVSTVFDDVVKELGDTHEYFYDRDSNLVMQRIQNFINDTFDPIKKPELNYMSYELEMNNYLPDYTGFPFAYDFSNKEGVVSYNNNPAWTNLKNDFVVSSQDGTSTLQIAIDKKPQIKDTREWFKNVLKEYEENPGSVDLEFLRMDGNLTRMPYDAEEDTVPFLYKEKTNRTDPVYIDIPLEKVPWQIAHGLRNFISRNIYKVLGSVRTLPRWGNECESMIFKYTATVDKELLVPNMGIFNPASIPTGNVWLSGYPIAQVAENISDSEKLDYDNPFFTPEGDSAYWMYFLDIIDESTKLGRYSIDKIGRRTQVTTDDRASTIFRTNPTNIVVVTESELGGMGGRRLLDDMKSRGQAYCVIRNTNDQLFLQPAYTDADTKNSYPFKSITGDIALSQNQYLQEGPKKYLVGGGNKDIAFEINTNFNGAELSGAIAIKSGEFKHPITKQVFKNPVMNVRYNEIRTPVEIASADTDIFIAYIKNKETRLKFSASTDPIFTAIKLDAAGRTYHSVIKAGAKYASWEEFPFDHSESGDCIIAWAGQEVSKEGSSWVGNGYFDSIIELFNIRDAELVGLFSSDGAVDCFSVLRNSLYLYTNFSEVITISALPVYHLEPNTLIRVEDEFADIHGIFMITSISIPMSVDGGTMSINAIKVNQRI